MPIKSLSVAVAIVLLMMNVNSALAQAAVYGLGTTSCGYYLQKKATQPFTVGYEAWTTGYLSAMAQQLQIKDFLSGTDLDGAMVWIDNYCQQNPVESFYDANYKLTIFLGHRQITK